MANEAAHNGQVDLVNALRGAAQEMRELPNNDIPEGHELDSDIESLEEMQFDEQAARGVQVRSFSTFNFCVNTTDWSK